MIIGQQAEFKVARKSWGYLTGITGIHWLANVYAHQTLILYTVKRPYFFWNYTLHHFQGFYETMESCCHSEGYTVVKWLNERILRQICLMYK